MPKIKLVNSVSNQLDKTTGKRKKVYLDEAGNPTEDPNKIKNIQREIELSKGRNYVGTSGIPLTKSEYEAVKSQLYPEMESKGGVITPEAQKAIDAEMAQRQAPMIATAQNLDQQGAFKETTQRQDLAGATKINEQAVLNIGNNLPSIQALRSQFIVDIVNQGAISNMTLDQFKNNPEVLNDPTLSSLITTEMDLEVLKSGEAQASKLGTLVESIPFISGIARKYGGNLIQTPSSDVDDIMSELTKISTSLKDSKTFLTNGGSPSVVLTNANNYEQRISFLESKIKILIAQSPELRSNPEEVDALMEQIQGVYNDITNARLDAANTQIVAQGGSPTNALLLLEKYRNASRE